MDPVTQIIEVAREVSPIFAVALAIFGVVSWQLLRLYRDEREENRRTSDARIEDGMAQQALIREVTSAMVAQTSATNEMNNRLDRIERELERRS